jgi:hypothetical protein
MGTAIGMVAGYASGVAIEAKDTQISNRKRKIKFFLDKMKAEENQQDSIVKLAKDLITRRAVLGVLYNSPFALFLPALESGDTVQTVTSAYVSEFNRDINTLANDHTGYDAATIMNDTSKSWLKAVVDDMCSYITSTGSQTVPVTNADGSTSTTTATYLYVNVTLKSYRDMISVYGLGTDEVAMLEQIMSADFMGQRKLL